MSVFSVLINWIHKTLFKSINSKFAKLHDILYKSKGTSNILNSNISPCLTRNFMNTNIFNIQIFYEAH